MWCVYIIECEDGTLYTGIAKNASQRFFEHRNGRGGRYTRAHKVKKVLYVELQGTKSAALKREAEIKFLRRKEKLDLIQARRLNSRSK